MKTLMLTLLMVLAGLVSACTRTDAQPSGAPPAAGVTAAPVVAKEVTAWGDMVKKAGAAGIE